MSLQVQIVLNLTQYVPSTAYQQVWLVLWQCQYSCLPPTLCHHGDPM